MAAVARGAARSSAQPRSKAAPKAKVARRGKASAYATAKQSGPPGFGLSPVSAVAIVAVAAVLGAVGFLASDARVHRFAAKVRTGRFARRKALAKS